MPEGSTRPLWFTLLLLLAIAGPALAIPTVLVESKSVFERFPKLSWSILWTQIAFALVGVGGAVALLLGRRAGVWLVLLSGLGIVGADLLYESFGHAAAASGLTVAIGFAVRANWTRLR